MSGTSGVTGVADRAAVDERVLIATDLDRTLVYSRAAAGPPRPGEPAWVVVEHLEGREVSYLTPTAAERCAALAAARRLVPVTTRTPEQYARIVLPGPPAQYAVTANGGVLLVDGRPDASWDARVRSALRTVAGLEEARGELVRACGSDPSAQVRTVPELFCYAVVDRPRLDPASLERLHAWGSAAGWVASLQGRKLYLVPVPLTKAAATAEVARRTGARHVLAAGDSLLDVDLLELADLGVRPGHGEIADSGWSSPTVTALETTGIRAGEEVLAWFAARAEELVGRPGER